MRRGENLSYQDIAAYHSVTGIRLKSWEVEALFRMDGAVSQFFAERMRNA